MGKSGLSGRMAGRIRGVVLAAMVAGALSAAPTSLAAVFTVNSADDGTDGVCDVLDCTLREAIEASNGTGGNDVIDFRVGVGGPATIRPFSALPQITDSVLVDGTSQPGYSGSPLIELDGSFLGPGTAGLSVTASSSQIHGLAVNRFAGNGIELIGGGNNSVTSSYVGVGLDGATASGNGNGIVSSSETNTIGGTAASLRNVISGNTQSGVELSGGGADTVKGNFVGTDASGNIAVPNFRGIAVGSSGNTIGDASGGRNVVSGNTDAGLIVTAGDNAITGNYVGTDADATVAVPNGFGGVYILGGEISASANTLTANVISGNKSFGVLIQSTIASSAGNNIFERNLIGTDASGQKALGNTGPGIAIGAGSGLGNNVIGDSRSSSNTIAYNQKGISLGPDTARNRFSANSIHDNTFGGIDLDDDGVTPNDPDDVDTGANERVNFPELSNVVRNADGTVTVSGSYDGALPNSFYQVDFYATPSCDESGFGEGETWIGARSFGSDGAGDFTFNTDNTLLTQVEPGSAVAATATDGLGGDVRVLGVR